MRKLIQLCFLFAALAVRAQLPMVIGDPNLPFDGTGVAPIARSLTGVLEYWVASDLPTNSSVNAWTGRLQGWVWTNAASTQRPTNSASGIWMDVSHFLTNNNQIVANTNVSFGLILKVVDSGFYSGEIHPSLFNNTSGKVSDDASVIGYQFNFNSGLYDLNLQANGTFNSLSEAPFNDTNHVTDIVLTQYLTNNGSLFLSLKSYTNGILDKKILAGAPGGGKYWGSTTTPPTPAWPNSLGENFPRSSSARFFIQEFWIWTNGFVGTADGQDISASTLASFHQWGTNTYGYSP